MTRKEGVLLASRTLAVILLSWALVECTYIPERLFAFAHHAGLSNMTIENYLRNYDFIYLALLFIRMVALLAAANWFYQCGVKVENFFFSAAEATSGD